MSVRSAILKQGASETNRPGSPGYRLDQFQSRTALLTRLGLCGIWATVLFWAAEALIHVPTSDLSSSTFALLNLSEPADTGPYAQRWLPVEYLFGGWSTWYGFRLASETLSWTGFGVVIASRLAKQGWSFAGLLAIFVSTVSVGYVIVNPSVHEAPSFALPFDDFEAGYTRSFGAAGGWSSDLGIRPSEEAFLLAQYWLKKNDAGKLNEILPLNVDLNSIPKWVRKDVIFRLNEMAKLAGTPALAEPINQEDLFTYRKQWQSKSDALASVRIGLKLSVAFTILVGLPALILHLRKKRILKRIEGLGT